MTWFASGWTRHRDVKTGKTWWQPINCLIRKDNTSAANCLDFFFFLEPLWCQGWVNFLSSPPKKKKKKKKVDRPDRREDRFWQIPAFFHWNTLKGKTKGGRGGWGRGPASKWATEPRRQQMVWKHASTCADTHETWYHKPRHVAGLAR